MRVIEAEDDGDLGKLASVTVPKQLAVKVGCPVILTVNLSDELVNGLAGEVRVMTQDTIDVYFESLKRQKSTGQYPEFYGKEQYLPKVDWSCCKKHVPEVIEMCSQEYEDLFTPFEDITETLSDDDTEAMIGLVDLMEDESEETTKEKVSAISKLLYKPHKTDTVRELKCELKCLQQVVDSESFLAEHSNDKGSLLETRRKQNVRSGLTNITDEAANCFMQLDKKIRQLETTSNLNVHGASFDLYMQTKLRTDSAILCTFSKLFNPTTTGDTCKKLLSEVLSKYCKMSLGQLRKTYLKEVQTTKTEAHRKQIKMRGKGRKVDSL
ncbi:unnamed protein product [Mytilus edulis]|uniref:Uncharacterized protein n=1 Tax=Mytilus edulis TaxID=6550 RepID=A0A8S3S4P3_MYTED|nr:unnamed protein product [Mytilus edulis]